ncbi:MAG TPA: hypothetical protein PLE33_00390 [Candidatus Cloacimonas sp.]|nr:hypothetical protein [Candidatus Cloacimonas sp.]
MCSIDNGKTTSCRLLVDPDVSISGKTTSCRLMVGRDASISGKTTSGLSHFTT